MSNVAWIKMIDDDEADEILKKVFDTARTPHGSLDNVMRVHSLRPETMIGHLRLYKSVLHSDDITLPLWFLEIVATHVSILNNCDYSFTHHWNNAKILIGDSARSNKMLKALKGNWFENIFTDKEAALIKYAEKLTLNVGCMHKEDISRLRAVECDDGEILEVNQVVAYFNYSNRLLNGLGVSLRGDKIGFYK